MPAIPIYSINLPEYRVDKEPNHEEVGRVVDTQIKQHFLGQDIAIRALASIEHPGKSIDELIEIIKTLGTDRYDSQRVGDRYENVQGKHIDFFALPFRVTEKSEMFSELTWPFYHWGIKSRGHPLRVDILTIYDPAQLEVVEHTYQGRTDIKKDGFIFKNPAEKQKTIEALFKIT